MPVASTPGRRRVLAAAAGLLAFRAAPVGVAQARVAPPHRSAAPHPPAPPLPTPDAGFPEGAALLVAGPPGGRMDRWADLLVPALARALPGAFAGLAAHPAARSAVGGPDGVTGANQFEALVPPDGGTALLLPGSAATAWLVGDPRAQFDAARWAPAWACVASAVLMSRAPLNPGRTLRLAGAHPAGPALPALLALDMLGVPVAPSAAKDADAVFHSGQGARAAAAAQRGMMPVLTLGAPDAAGAWGRDPAFPAVPTAAEAAARRSPAPAALAALRAASAATMLDAALVLPGLTPANRMALWRRASAEAAAAPEMQAEAAALGIRSVSQPAAAALLAAIAADLPALLSLRGWFERWNWRPAD